MPVHADVLRAALARCDPDGVFRLRDILDELPGLNEQTVRTHVSSRCCVNAPKNHPHKWDYFRRIGRGVYQIAEAFRQPRGLEEPPNTTRAALQRRDVIHVTVTQDGDTYVAECLELPVVTQARSIDRLLANLEEAIELHLEGEDRVALGLANKLKIALSAEVAFERA
jgi:predicted RNase H-like HicB family nuclease